MSELKQTDLSKRLREHAKGGDLYCTNTENSLLRAAADEIERYYTGMLNWKATAEAQSTQLEATKPAQDLGAVDSETVKDARDYKKDCEILLDIWDDGKNHYEHRCYVSGTLEQHLEEVRAAILQSQGGKNG